MTVAKEKTHHTDNSCDAYQKSEKNKMFIIENDIYAYFIGRYLIIMVDIFYTKTSQNKLYFNAWRLPTPRLLLNP